MPVETTLRELRNLSYLSLNGNKFDDDSDLNRFQSFANLRSLFLENNSFKKFPIALLRILTLEYLDISFNVILTLTPGEVDEIKQIYGDPPRKCIICAKEVFKNIISLAPTITLLKFLRDNQLIQE